MAQQFSHTIKFITLPGNINFSANPLPGTPRIIDVDTLSDISEDNPLPPHLTAPDLMVTVLYNINEKALLALFDPEIEDFTFRLVLCKSFGANHCLIRKGKDIWIGTGPNPYDEYKIRYQVQDDGVWKITSSQRFIGYIKNRVDKRSLYEDSIAERRGQEGKKAQKCKMFDNDFAQMIALDKPWRCHPGTIVEGIVLSFKGSDDIGIDFGGYARLSQFEDIFTGECFLPYGMPQQVNEDKTSLKSTAACTPLPSINSTSQVSPTKPLKIKIILKVMPTETGVLRKDRTPLPRSRALAATKPVLPSPASLAIAPSAEQEQPDIKVNPQKCDEDTIIVQPLHVASSRKRVHLDEAPPVEQKPKKKQRLKQRRSTGAKSSNKTRNSKQCTACRELLSR